MRVLSVKMSEFEYSALKNYASNNSISMSKAIKDAFFEKLEDEYDIECFDKAYADYLKNKKTYSYNKVIKAIGIDS